MQLAGINQSVSWTNNTDRSITGINIRYSIPDAPNGGGLSETLDLYVNGVFRQVLHLTSAQTWVYQTAIGKNGMDQTLAPGLYPHVFFDEMHTWIEGDPIIPGSTLMLKQDASNTAEFYDIDLIDLESPPDPLPKPSNFLSVNDFGARPDDLSLDNTPAFNRCIAAAEAQKKGVWVPVGKYYLTAPPKYAVLARNVTIEGAGPWYSTLYRTTPKDFNGSPDMLRCSSCTIRNLAFDSNAISLEPGGGYCSAIYMLGTGWVLDNIWSQHASLLHSVALSGTVENCRVNNAWGKGILIANGVPDDPKTDATLHIQNNFCRGNVGIGIDLEEYSKFPYIHSPQISNNTVVCCLWGANLVIGGGSDITVENNLLRDPTTDANLIVGEFYASLDSVVVEGNVLTRGGGVKPPNASIASLIIGSTRNQAENPTKVSNLDVVDNIISDSLYTGVVLGSSLSTVLQNNTISSPGKSGIEVFGDGPGVLSGNVISGIANGELPIVNSPGGRPLLLPITAASYNGASPEVSCEACSEGGRDVSHLTNGSYLLYRGLDMSDVTSFVARVAPESAGANIEVRLDDPKGPLITSVVVSGTGDGTVWKTVYSPTRQTGGCHDVYVVCTGGGGDLLRLEWLCFYAEPPVTLAASYSTVYSAVPNTMTPETGNEKVTALGHIPDNTYTSYDNVDLTGKENFYARVSTLGLGGRIDIRIDSPTGTLLGSSVVPNTPGWGKWKTVSCKLGNTVGIHQLYLLYYGQIAGDPRSTFDFEWFAFDLPNPGEVPAVRMNSASPDIKVASCANGGQYLGSFSNGDYVAYNDINMTGLTSFTVRLASLTHIGGDLQVRLDSPTGPIVGSCQVPLTGGWHAWMNQSCSLTPSEGFHNLYLVYNVYPGNTFNLRSFQLSFPNIVSPL